MTADSVTADRVTVEEMGVSYWGELRGNLRPLIAASLGSGTSIPLYAYSNSVFAPVLIKEFGWSRAQFALMGVTILITLVILPFVGRFTDRLGVRRVALTGTCLIPFCFIGYALMQGSFLYFPFVSTAVLMIGAMTSPLVYSRLIAENFRRSTGLALTIVNCTPAVLAIAMVPTLNWSIEHVGWRVSYLGLGALSFVAGMAAILLIRDGGTGQPVRPAVDRTARGDYRLILRSPVFWIILTAMFLCQLPTPIHSSQMNLLLLDNGLTAAQAAVIVSVYAFGTVVGRIACGFALDYCPTPIVASLSMLLPAVGYCLLGSSLDTLSIVTLAMFFVGLSVGAESDLISYLVARYFQLRIYNTTLSFLFCSSFLSSAIGALAISFTLQRWDSFAPFLFFVAGAIVIGSLLFLFMPMRRDVQKVG